jgi:hypothetical protein
MILEHADPIRGHPKNVLGIHSQAGTGFVLFVVDSIAIAREPLPYEGSTKGSDLKEPLVLEYSANSKVFRAVSVFLPLAIAPRLSISSSDRIGHSSMLRHEAGLIVPSSEYNETWILGDK